MTRGSQLVFGLNPIGDYSNLQMLRIKERSFAAYCTRNNREVPSNRKGTLRKLRKLNTPEALRQRSQSIKDYHIEMGKLYYNIYKNLLLQKKCDHVSISLLEHNALFKDRSQGNLRDQGDTMFHLGANARIYRMLDLLRNIK